MIKNEKQFNVSKNRKSELEESLRKIKISEISEFDKIMINALESQIVSINEEILEYLRLKEEKPMVISSKIEDLPKALIKARIIKGLTHNDIAILIGLKEQQIQRYEADEYSSAKFERMMEIAKVMHIRFDDTKVSLDDTKVSLDEKLNLKNTDSRLVERATKRLHSEKSLFL